MSVLSLVSAVIAALPLRGMPISPSTHKRFEDGSLIRVWLWQEAPVGITKQIGPKLEEHEAREPEYVVVSQAGADSYSGTIVAEGLESEWIEYFTVNTTEDGNLRVAVTGR